MTMTAATAGLGMLGIVAPAFAAPPIPPRHTQPYPEDSGVHSNFGTETVLAWQTVVLANSAPWIRLHFGEADLGQSSWLEITSLLDDGWQRLDAKSMAEWNLASAFFNGDRVMVRLHVGPGDEGVFVRMDHLTVGEWVGADGPDDLRSLCGSDNRIASTDNRSGRLYFGGCTAWRITTGAFLTAGHCVDFDPDQGGPALPDGVLDLSGVVEFNVPASLSNGTTVAANPNDQYPINTAGVLWRFDGENQGIGKDWSVFGVFANSNTGLLPHQAYGLPHRMTRENPAAGNTIRVTGFGSDSGTTNFTNQTDTGPYVTENVTSSDQISHEYQVDTTGGSSGSPVIWNSNGLTIAIHTNAGCSATNGNTGTSFEVNALENAIRNYINSAARFVDVGHPLRVAEEGTAYRPYSTVTLGVTNVVSGGVVSIVAGNYTSAAGNVFTIGADGKSMQLTAPAGTVTIGD